MAGSTGRAPVTITAIKADVGSIAGHTQPSAEMLSAASELMEQQRGKLLIDFRVTHTGDDICLTMTGPDQISPVRAGVKTGHWPLFRSADRCGPGGPAVSLLDCAEDHRRGALD